MGPSDPWKDAISFAVAVFVILLLGSGATWHVARETRRVLAEGMGEDPSGLAPLDLLLVGAMVATVILLAMPLAPVLDQVLRPLPGGWGLALGGLTTFATVTLAFRLRRPLAVRRNPCTRILSAALFCFAVYTGVGIAIGVLCFGVFAVVGDELWAWAVAVSGPVLGLVGGTVGVAVGQLGRPPSPFR